MTLKHIKIMAAEGLRERSHEAAWKRRTTTSALVREGLTRYVEHGLTGPTRLSKTDPGSGTGRIRFKVEPELWETAVNRAILDDVPIAMVVRRLLQRTIELEKVK